MATFYPSNGKAKTFVNGLTFANGTGIIYTAATPEGVETAPVGTLCIDTTNGDYYFKATGAGNTGWVEIPTGTDAPLLFKGSITTAADFPLPTDVQNGWFYRITANVIDNDGTKTNTGQSFLSGDEIAWNGTDWTVLGRESNPTVWQASTGYTAGDVVSYQGFKLLCTTGHTSNATDIDADLANWSSMDKNAVITATAGLVTGNPIKIDTTTGAYAKAQADSSSNVATTVCLASDGTNALLVDSGHITLTTAEWDAIAGTTGGLTAGQYYWLDGTTAGNITATAPSVAPAQCILQAISTTDALITLDDPQGYSLPAPAATYVKKQPTTDYTVLTADIEVVAKAGCTQVTLYDTASFPSDVTFLLRVSNQSGADISLVAGGGNTISGLASVTIADGSGKLLAVDGTNWIEY